MATSYAYCVSFRVHHPQMAASSIAGLLGWRAEFAWTAGEPRTTPHGEPLGGLRKSSYATFKLAAGPRSSLNATLDAALRALEGREGSLRELLVTGGTLDFFIGLYGTKALGLELKHDLLRRCAALQIDIGMLLSPSPMPAYVRRGANRLDEGPRATS